MTIKLNETAGQRKFKHKCTGHNHHCMICVPLSEKEFRKAKRKKKIHTHINKQNKLGRARDKNNLDKDS